MSAISCVKGLTEECHYFYMVDLSDQLDKMEQNNGYHAWKPL
jgi:hypothetical protein